MEIEHSKVNCCLYCLREILRQAHQSSSFCWDGMLILKELRNAAGWPKEGWEQKGREREISPNLFLSADAPQPIFCSVPHFVLLLPSSFLCVWPWKLLTTLTVCPFSCSSSTAHFLPAPWYIYLAFFCFLLELLTSWEQPQPLITCLCSLLEMKKQSKRKIVLTSKPIKIQCCISGWVGVLACIFISD